MTSAAITGASTVRLLGRDLSLVYDLDACDYLYDQGLDPWGPGLIERLKQAKPGHIAAFVYAGIKRGAPDVSMEQIRALPARDVMRAFGAALRSYLEQMGDGDKDGASGNPHNAGDPSPA
jgi:hypothetical protein